MEWSGRASAAPVRLSITGRAEVLSALFIGPELLAQGAKEL
jgi:hypothetical protein